jgi:CRP/FNR family transcriptional regulator, cyclic AMP receptor protein
MPVMEKVLVLKHTKLFKDLPPEALFAIAKEVEMKDMAKGDRIFAEGDAPTGLYIVVSGEVSLTQQGRVLSQCSKHDFFGELALIDGYARVATATAVTDGALLFMDKPTFDHITEDLPAVLEVLVRVLMGYLRK